jgi:hypothetical protein
VTRERTSEPICAAQVSFKQGISALQTLPRQLSRHPNSDWQDKDLIPEHHRWLWG